LDSREPRKHIGGTEVTTRSHGPSYFSARRKHQSVGASPRAPPEVTNCIGKTPETAHDERRRPQANLKRDETALGKVEGKVCSQEGQKPPSNECRFQKEVVGVDEGALGSEEKGEGLVLIAGRAINDVFFIRRKTREWRDEWSACSR
jgi:hypothetical protein